MNVCDIEAARGWDKNKVYILDTETTGLRKNDEVLSLSIVNFNGVVVFDELIKPRNRKTWKAAQEIHGISYDAVKDKKQLVEYEEQLKPFFSKGCLIVGYNIEFDRKMLEQSGVKFECDFFDVMKTFSQGKKWCKLAECAEHYGYGKFSAHGSLEDTKATAYCLGCLLNDETKHNIDVETANAPLKEKSKKPYMSCYINSDGSITDEPKHYDDDINDELESLNEWIELKQMKREKEKKKQEENAGCYVFLIIVAFFIIGSLFILF